MKNLSLIICSVLIVFAFIPGLIGAYKFGYNSAKMELENKSLNNIGEAYSESVEIRQRINNMDADDLFDLRSRMYTTEDEGIDIETLYRLLCTDTVRPSEEYHFSSP